MEPVRSLIVRRWNAIVQFLRRMTGGRNVFEIYYAQPLWTRVLCAAVLTVALAHVLAALYKGTFSVGGMWKPTGSGDLTSGYLFGTGQYRRKAIYRTARKYARDKTWSHGSIAGLTFRLGNLTVSSALLRFMLSLIYLPLAALGMVEMLLRYLFSAVLFGGAELAHFLILECLHVLAVIFTPLFRASDKMNRHSQHCVRCFAEFDLPEYECPSCARRYAHLQPGSTGLRYARCKCGTALPVMNSVGRFELKGFCPACGAELASNDSAQTTLAAVGLGGSDQQILIASAALAFADAAKKHPEHRLRTCFDAHKAARTIVLSQDGRDRESVVLYDVEEHALAQSESERHPLCFAFADGILLYVEPDIAPVRRIPGTADGLSFCRAEALIEELILTYSRIIGLNPNQMSDIPIAVVIQKAMLKGYAGRSLSRDECRSALASTNLYNGVLLLESVFSKVSYFCLQDQGADADNGKRLAAPLLSLLPCTVPCMRTMLTQISDMQY